MAKQTRECWVMFADREAVGVFTNHRTATIERLRFSKEEDMIEAKDGPTHVKLAFRLSKAVTLVED